ncbi:MAG: DUF5686 and carboxypeptidase regulatory-like domain-containing protein [Cyclobacteriaceae bacterium]|nr:DUF5686 and carboxypeptidase regulatory-like domain-containing protein [Cyclobacteriaceae bacterium]
MKNLFFVLLFLVQTLISFAGGVKGQIKGDDGSTLGFTTIYVKQLGTGTAANENGLYELSLPAGEYDLVFQYVGFETLTKKITVENTFIELNVTLKTQTVVLQNVTVTAGNEDPAYTIMRKAIAKAKYHTQQLDRYSAQVYIKGTGQVKDYPWMFKKEMEKEGIEKDRVFISESVSEIEYIRPNTFKEKVISVHSDGKDNNTSPNAFIFGSFYNEEIAETVSPLSPKSFSYYKFEYDGTFKDRNYEVSRIKVKPRAAGDNVVSGVLFIVEDFWTIHSLDFNTTKLGIKFNIKQVYAPVEEKAWMPVSHRFKVDGRVFGFEFEYNYLSTLSNYKIDLNKELYVESIDVIDEKIEKEKAKTITENKNSKSQDLQKRLSEGKEITRKELKTILKEYEKQEQQQQKEPDVVANYTYEKDSIKKTLDTAYWNTIRPVPLTKLEIKGYQKADSLAQIERKKEEGDTVKQKKHKGFQPWDILLGDSYKISKRTRFTIETPGGGFNTVEGWNLIYKMRLGTIFKDTNRTQLVFTPTLRYSFEREKLSGYLNSTLRNKNFRLTINGGRYIRQFNAEEPILPIVNTLTTLLLEQNLMKIYERDFAEIIFRPRIHKKMTVNIQAEYAHRRELNNTSNYKWVDRKSIESYSSNQPFVQEFNANIITPTHQAFVTQIGISARPWLKYSIRNKVKSEIENSSPTLSFNWTRGWNAFDSDVEYDRIEVGFKHSKRLGARGRLDVNFQGGIFTNANAFYFMDYKHFLGNRTPFTTSDPVRSFRLLDYYKFSTADEYFVGNAHYQFRRFLVTSIPFVRLMGIREDVFVNYLATPFSRNYTEVGYTIDGILRILRLEAAASFENGVFVDYGFRIGVATNIAIRFSDN